MDFTFNTQIVDVSVALKALQLYRDKDYKQCLSTLLDVLDMEPRNWQARLMVGACYFKTTQWASAQRTFRWLVDNCDEAETKRKAIEGLQAATAKLQQPAVLPMEFGSYVQPTTKERISWLD